jgi:hypothetical protein
MLPEQYYLNRKELLLADFHSLLRKKSQLGWARFIVMVGIFIAGYFSFHIGLIFIVAVILLTVIFVRLIYADTDNKKIISHTQQLIQINNALFDVELSLAIRDKRVGDPDFLVANNSKAKELLSWHPQLGIEVMMKDHKSYRQSIN